MLSKKILLQVFAMQISASKKKSFHARRDALVASRERMPWLLAHALLEKQPVVVVLFCCCGCCKAVVCCKQNKTKQNTP